MTFTDFRPAIVDPAPTERPPGGSLPDRDGGQTGGDTQTRSAPVPIDNGALSLAADILDDLERVRIANANRLATLTRGDEYGHGMDETNPDVRNLAAMVANLAELEHVAELNLKRVMRKHPLGPWIKATIGVGEKQGARLLAAIGDPYWNTLHDCPRTVSALWAYSGLHVLPIGGHHSDGNRWPIAADRALGSSNPGQRPSDTQADDAGVAAKRKKGVKSNWSGNAKMRAYLIAESCIKQSRSPYRATYDARRAHTAVTHPDWPLGHSHNDALRIVSKAVLRDLWREARRIHGVTDGQA